MGVRIGGVWHEELPDPGTGGTDSGNGRNFNSQDDYTAAAAGGGTSSGGAPAGTTNKVGQIGGTPGGTSTITLPGAGGISGASAAAVDAYLAAIAAGNVAAANEAIRQFNVVHQNDAAAFAQTTATNAANIAAQQAALTGQFNGQSTLAATTAAQQNALGVAGLTGYYNAPGAAAGVTQASVTAAQQNEERLRAVADQANAAYNANPNDANLRSALVSARQAFTDAAQTASTAQTAFAANPAGQANAQGTQTLAGQLQQATLSGMQANGQPTEAARQFNLGQGLSALTLASNLTASPFRQAQALYGLGQGGYTPLMAAAAGTGPSVTSFQAPTLSAADTATLPWLASQTGGNTYTADQSQQWMGALPNPNAVNWTAVGQAGPGAQDLVTQGLTAKYGLGASDIKAIQMAAMPQFSAPTLAGSFKG